MITPIRNGASYIDTLGQTLRNMSSETIDRIAAELLKAYSKDRNIFVFGNGGSAATASHFACDLGKGTAKALPTNARRFRVTALTDNVPIMTAWANDLSYDEVFTEQLRNLLRPSDICIAISGSGNSRNILSALRYAQLTASTSIGLAGFDGGAMKSLCNHCLIVPSGNMEVIEDLHLAVCHSLSTIIRSALFEMFPADLRPPAYETAHLPICSDSGTSPSRSFEIVASGVNSTRLSSRNHVDAD